MDRGLNTWSTVTEQLHFGLWLEPDFNAAELLKEATCFQELIQFVGQLNQKRKTSVKVCIGM